MLLSFSGGPTREDIFTPGERFPALPAVKATLTAIKATPSAIKTRTNDKNTCCNRNCLEHLYKQSLQYIYNKRYGKRDPEPEVSGSNPG